MFKTDHEMIVKTDHKKREFNCVGTTKQKSIFWRYIHLPLSSRYVFGEPIALPFFKEYILLEYRG